MKPLEPDKSKLSMVIQFATLELKRMLEPEWFKWEEKLKIDTSIISNNVVNTGKIQVKIQLADLIKYSLLQGLCYPI